MKKTTQLLLLILIAHQTFSQQKPLIDTAMLNSWPGISAYETDVALSRDGRFLAYILYNEPVNHQTLIIQDLRTGQKQTILCNNASILFFTTDDRNLCYQNKDSIWLQETSSKKNRLLGSSVGISYAIASKRSCLLIPTQQDTNNFRLIDLINNQEKSLSVQSHIWLNQGKKLLFTTTREQLKLIDLLSGREQSYGRVKEYQLIDGEKSILLLRDTQQYEYLELVGIDDCRSITLWVGQPGEHPTSYTFDKSGKQLAFTVQTQKAKSSIWHYQLGQAKAILAIDDSLTGFPKELSISGFHWLGIRDNWLFFQVRKQLQQDKPEKVITQVDIWSYRDPVILPAQQGEKPSFSDFTAVRNLASGKTILLENDDNRITDYLQDHVILETGTQEVGFWWPHNGPHAYWLQSLNQGSKTLIHKDIGDARGSIMLSTSPNGRWIIFWDPVKEHYYSLDPLTKKLTNLTENLPDKVTNDFDQVSNALPVGIAGWYPQDSAILLYDNYDIWRIALSGKHPPANITGGYGKKESIKLRLLYPDNFHLNPMDELLLSGYNVLSKENGFLSVELKNPSHLKTLTMGPYTYYQMTDTEQSFNTGMLPLFGGTGKNKHWIVMRHSDNEYPNFFISKDLTSFKAITHLQPHKAYNWLKTELLEWTTYNGLISRGVLYKPENFDSTRSYPVIFNYYQKYSHRCYQFPTPGLTTDNINIPWFVSRGYLVFTPDIQYIPANESGGMTVNEAAFNSIASAAEYLAQRQYVDKEHMALQGHSFGGQETAGIITKSNLFAAAAEVAGTMDNMSSYLTLVEGEATPLATEKMSKQDHGQLRMGASPWERADLYLRNSPVHNADKIHTPLLIAHNKKDGSINFRQGIEMYMALRRLAKPCWMLQYDSSTHVIWNKKDALDYTLRLTQYFDHYLKRMPPPVWMTHNTYSTSKGKSNLLDFDPTGTCSSICKVCRN